MEDKINRKITLEEYKKAQRVYWFVTTDKNMTDENWSRNGGGCDLNFASLGIAHIYMTGQKIKTARDLAKLDSVLSASVPDDFSLDDIAATIERTRDYVCRMQGRNFWV